MNEDDKLRDEFAALKRMDARGAPKFESLAQAPKVRPLRPVVLAAFPIVAAAAVLLLVWNATTLSEPARPTSPPLAAAAPPADVVPAITVASHDPADEPLPLDFLLQTHASYTDSDFLLRPLSRGQQP